MITRLAGLFVCFSLGTILSGCAYQEQCPNGDCIVNPYEEDGMTLGQPGTVSIGSGNDTTAPFVSPELEGKGFRSRY